MVNILTGHEHEAGIFVGCELFHTLLILAENDCFFKAVRQVMDVDIGTILLVIDTGEIEQIDLVGQVQGIAEILGKIEYPAGAVRFKDSNDLLVRVTVSGSLQSDLYLSRMMCVVIDEYGIADLLDFETALRAAVGTESLLNDERVKRQHVGQRKHSHCIIKKMFLRERQCIISDLLSRK